MKVNFFCFLGSALFLMNASFADSVCTGVLGSADHPCTAGNYWDSGHCTQCLPGRYCSGDGLAKCCDSNFPKSTYGTTNEQDCYTPCAENSDDTYSMQNCGLTKYVYENTDTGDQNYYVNCVENGVINIFTNSNEYHMEKSNGFRCFLNERPCDKFDIEWTHNPDNVTLDTVTVSGTAHWDTASNSVYDASECSSIATFQDNREQIKCKLKRPCPVYTTNLVSATMPIQFNNKATGNTIYYYCTECLNSGYYPTTDTPSGGQFLLPTCNNPHTGHHTACSCKPIPTGYYGTCNWTSAQSLDICSPIPCPAGKTTNGPETPSVDGCHYSTQTKICDNGGCKYLDSIGNLNDWLEL